MRQADGSEADDSLEVPLERSRVIASPPRCHEGRSERPASRKPVRGPMQLKPRGLFRAQRRLPFARRHVRRPAGARFALPGHSTGASAETPASFESPAARLAAYMREMTTYPTAQSDWRRPATKRGRSVQRSLLETHGSRMSPPCVSASWSASELAAFIGISTRALSKLRAGCGGLAFTKRGRGLEYRPSDVRDWLAEARSVPDRRPRSPDAPALSYDLDLNRPLLAPDAAAQFLGLNALTMASWRARGRGPAYYRLSPRTVRYAPADLEDWADHAVTT